MIAVFSVLIVLTISLSVVRVAAVALTLTGMSKQVARFQARSAFTTTGFATSEAEQVMSHPVRRRIVMLLMLWGNLGLGAVIATLMLSFVGVDPAGGWRGQLGTRLLILLIGLATLWLLATSPLIDRWMTRVISRAIRRWTNLDTLDYARLLHVAGEYVVTEFAVKPGNWMAGRTLRELRLSDEGVLVLGIEHPDGTYHGAPRGDTVVRPRDVVVLYGPHNRFVDLNRRRSDSGGDLAHQEAVSNQSAFERREKASDLAGS